MTVSDGRINTLGACWIHVCWGILIREFLDTLFSDVFTVVMLEDGRLWRVCA